MKKDLQAIIMAAGKSTRFKTGRSKLLEKICGQEMIAYPIKTLEKVDVPISLVVGYQKESLQQVVLQAINNPEAVSFIEQVEQRGTGHALVSSRPLWHKQHILVMNGDVPLVSQQLIENLYEQHCLSNAAVSFVVSHNFDPSLDSYGRVVTTNKITEIIEAKDYKAQLAQQGKKEENDPACCINAGIYIFERTFLQTAIDSLERSSVTGELYITDLVKTASQANQVVTMVEAPIDEIRGINTLRELWIAEQIKQAEIITHWMNAGVRFQVAQNIYVDIHTTIGQGSFIGQGVQLRGNSKLGNNTIIEGFSVVKDSSIGDNSIIKSFSVVEDTIIGQGVAIGPHARLENNTTIGDGSSVGSFSEITESTIGTQTQVRNLTYTGNATIGNDTFIGTGTIICNHDGKEKKETVIHDSVFIGGNNTIVAPITIGSHAYTGAGSVITHDVPEESLAIARAYQVTKKQPKLPTEKKSSAGGYTCAVKTPETQS